jgi:tetratricopeptide (TPR) repeat protein
MVAKHTFQTLIVLLVCAVPCTGSERVDITRAKNKVAKGDAQLVKNNYSAAGKLYRQAIDIDPRLPSAHLGLGATLIGQQRYQEAIAALADSERLYAEYEAQIREAQQKATNAVEDGERQAQVFRDTYGVFQRVPHNLGMGTHAMGLLNFDEASVVPAQLYYLQGISFLRTTQKQQGIERLQRCLTLAPEHGLAHHNLAAALFTQGKVEQAKQHFDAAIAAGVDPNPSLAADLERELDRMLATDTFVAHNTP